MCLLLDIDYGDSIKYLQMYGDLRGLHGWGVHAYPYSGEGVCILVLHFVSKRNMCQLDFIKRLAYIFLKKIAK